MSEKSVNSSTDNYSDRMMGIYTTTEPTAWEPGEPGELRVTAFDLPNYYEHGNQSTTSSLSRSFQTDQMSAIETDSYTSALSAEAPSQSFTANWSGAANGTMQLSPAMSISTSLAYSSNDEKENVGGWNLNRERSQVPFIPSSHLSLSLESMITHGQTAVGLVNSLAQCFHSQNDGMTNILGNILDPSDYDAYLATPSSFKTGIKALQRYYCGFVLKTLREIFPLIRIAFAAACLLYHREPSFPWDHFFQDVVQWSENIADPSEARLFLTAITAFHSFYQRSGGNYSRMSCACSCWMASSENLARYKHTSRSFSINTQTDIGRPPLFSRQQLVLSVCAQFLNHIEHSKVPPRDLASTSSTGFVARSPYLTHQTESDPLIHELDPAWRPRQYEILLDWVLAIFEDLVKKQGQSMNAAGEGELQSREQALDVTPVQVHDYPVFIGIDTTVYAPELSKKRVTSSFTIPSTSLSVGGIATDPFTLPPSPEPSTTYCQEFSSKNSSDAPKDPPILAHLPSPTVRSCGRCDKVFRGSRDSKNNLERHNKQFHDGNWKHACKVPGCGEVCPRSDYLQKHCEKFHSQPARTIVRRRKRKLDNTQGLQTHGSLHQG